MAAPSTPSKSDPFGTLLYNFERSGHFSSLSALLEEEELQWEPQSRFPVSEAADVKLRIGHLSQSVVYVFSNGRVELAPHGGAVTQQEDSADSVQDTTYGFDDLGPFDCVDPSFQYLPVVRYYFHRRASVTRWAGNIGPVPEYSVLRAALNNLYTSYPTYMAFRLQRKSELSKMRPVKPVSALCLIPTQPEDTADLSCFTQDLQSPLSDSSPGGSPDVPQHDEQAEQAYAESPSFLLTLPDIPAPLPESSGQEGIQGPNQGPPELAGNELTDDMAGISIERPDDGAQELQSSTPTQTPSHQHIEMFGYSEEDRGQLLESATKDACRKTTPVASPATHTPEPLVQQGAVEDGTDDSHDDNDIICICMNCSEQTRPGPDWRCSPKGHPLCNACYIYYEKHMVSRPLPQKTSVSHKRTGKPQGSRIANIKTARAPVTIQDWSPIPTKQKSSLGAAQTNKAKKTSPTIVSSGPLPTPKHALLLTKHSGVAGLHEASPAPVTRFISPQEAYHTAGGSLLDLPAAYRGTITNIRPNTDSDQVASYQGTIEDIRPVISAEQAQPYRGTIRNIKPMGDSKRPVSYEGIITDVQRLIGTDPVAGYHSAIMGFQPLIDFFESSQATRSSYATPCLDVEMEDAHDDYEVDSQHTITAPSSPEPTGDHLHCRLPSDDSMMEADEPVYSKAVHPTRFSHPSESSARASPDSFSDSSDEIPAREPASTDPDKERGALVVWSRKFIPSTENAGKDMPKPLLNQPAVHHTNRVTRAQTRAQTAEELIQMNEKDEENRQRGMAEVQNAWDVRRELRVLRGERSDCEHQIADAFRSHPAERVREIWEGILWLQRRTGQIDERIVVLEAEVRRREQDDTNSGCEYDADNELTDSADKKRKETEEVDVGYEADRE